MINAKLLSGTLVLGHFRLKLLALRQCVQFLMGAYVSDK